MTTTRRIAVVGPPGADLARVATRLGIAEDGARAESGSLRLLERLGADVEVPPALGTIDGHHATPAFVRAVTRLDGPVVGHAVGVTLRAWAQAPGGLDVHLVVPAPATVADLQSHRPRAAAARCWFDHVMTVLSVAPDATLHLEPTSVAERDPWSLLAGDLHSELLASEQPPDLRPYLRRAAELGPSTPVGLVAVASSMPRLPAPDDRAALVVARPLTRREAYDLAAVGWHPLGSDAGAVIAAARPRLAVALDRDALRDVLAAVTSHAPLTVIGAPADLAGETAAVDRVVSVEDLARPVDELVADVAIATGRLRAPSLTAAHARAGITSVIIPVHGHPDLTRACLDSLRHATPQPVEVIVVDDASPDGSADGLDDRSDIDHLVRLTTNHGFAGAVNAGLAVATGEFVCVLNNDTEPTEGWLEEMLETLAIPGTGLVGPRTNRISGRQQVPDAPQFTTEPPESLHAWARDWARARRGRSWRVPRLVGFCLVTRRSLLAELGALDHGVGRGNFEDDELCSRVRRAGLHCRVAEGAVVLHHGSATFRALRIDHAAAMLAGARHTAGRLLLDDDLVGAEVDVQGASIDDIGRTLRSILWLTPSVVLRGVRAPHLLGALPDVRPTFRVDTEPDVAPDVRLVMTAGEILPVLDMAATRAALDGTRGRMDVDELVAIASTGSSDQAVAGAR